jgi:RNA polymerase sigma factor (sigma-70 family)
MAAGETEKEQAMNAVIKRFLRNNPRLTAESETALGRWIEICRDNAAAAGLDTNAGRIWADEAKAAERRLIEAHIRLAAAFARRGTWRGLGPDEKLSAAFEGLAASAAKWRPGAGRFAPFAWWFMQRAALDAASALAWPVRLPFHVVTGLALAMEKNPALAAALGPVKPLDAPAFDDGAKTVADVVADENAENPEAAAVAASVRAWLRAALAGIPDRERAAVAARFGLDGVQRSMTETAAGFGVSHQAASQMASRGLMRLRLAAVSDGV